jgi:hypothetical protein
VTTPALVLYASETDLKLVLDSTDAGTGTAAQLSDEQLTLALQAATNRVTTYTDEVYNPADGSMPGIIHDLTLDLAAWWATTYYLKHKEMPPTHPVQLRYDEAKKVLDDIRQGVINIDFAARGTQATPTVINKIPNIFTGEDSNTTVQNDDLLVSTPPDMWSRPSIINNQWIEYTG